MYLGIALSIAAAILVSRGAEGLTVRWSEATWPDGSKGRSWPVLLVATVLFPLCYLRVGFTPVLLLDWAVIVILAALSLIDYRHRIIPNGIVLPAALAGLTVSVVLAPQSWPEYMLSGTIAFAALLLLALAHPGGLGMGDVKMAAFLGVVLGYQVLLALLTAFVFAGMAGGALIISGRLSRKDPIPFGPFLAAGAITTLLAGPEITSAYVSALR